MALYIKIETDTSLTYLTRIVSAAKQTCVLGGWAVYLTVNEPYSREQGRNYLGSRDIDLGFNISKSLPSSQLPTTDFGVSLNALEALGFRQTGFRYYKAFNYETGKELTNDETRTMPAHDIFMLYIDPIITEVHPALRKTFGFTSPDEPLLSLVFSNPQYRQEITALNTRVWLPSPEVLLAMKVNCLPRRTKDDKLIKDVCDIYALLWYSGRPFEKVRQGALEILKKNQVQALR